MPVVARVPLIPGITATENNLEGISRFLQKHGIKTCALMPYNPLWRDKAANNGVAISYSNPEFMSQREEEKCAQLISSQLDP